METVRGRELSVVCKVFPAHTPSHCRACVSHACPPQGQGMHLRSVKEPKKAEKPEKPEGASLQFHSSSEFWLFSSCGWG